MIDLKKFKYKGTQVAYYVVCKRKLWLFSRGISLEHLSEFVALGKLLDEESFKREKEEIFDDEPIRIDFIKTDKGVVVHEIKSSKAIDEAHLLQVRYYMYYLKRKGVQVSHGILHYPKLRQIQKVYLTDEDEALIEEVLEGIEEVLSMSNAPPVEKKPYCKKCAYEEFCHG